jgi:hypothetical protein
MVHATACNVQRLAMSSTSVSSLALIGVQLDCIGVALKEVLARIETARIAAAQAAEHETAQAEQPAEQAAEQQTSVLELVLSGLVKLEKWTC